MKNTESSLPKGPEGPADKLSRRLENELCFIITIIMENELIFSNHLRLQPIGHDRRLYCKVIFSKKNHLIGNPRGFKITISVDFGGGHNKAGGIL